MIPYNIHYILNGEIHLYKNTPCIPRKDDLIRIVEIVYNIKSVTWIEDEPGYRVDIIINKEINP